MPQAYYPLQKLQLFPVYRTRAEYRAAVGEDAPAYDPARAPKFWFDPAAASSTQRVCVYNNAYYPGSQPMFDAVILKRDEAATVNIYEAGIDSPDPREAEIPVPMRELTPSEEIVRDALGNPLVHDTATDQAQDGFSASDRALLKAIATKLGLAA